jgi:tRNA A37 methylthiotransferase MiaB
VPEAVKRKRNNELLAIQHRISEQVSREYVGREVEVFIEGLSRREQKKRLAGASAAAKGNGFIGLTIRGHTPDGMEGACEVACGTEASHVQEFEEATDAPVQLTARTEGDLIVHIDQSRDDSPERLIGRIVRVKIVDSRPLSLMGELTAG